MVAASLRAAMRTNAPDAGSGAGGTGRGRTRNRKATSIARNKLSRMAGKATRWIPQTSSCMMTLADAISLSIGRLATQPTKYNRPDKNRMSHSWERDGTRICSVLTWKVDRQGQLPFFPRHGIPYRTRQAARRSNFPFAWRTHSLRFRFIHLYSFIKLTHSIAYHVALRQPLRLT